MQLAALAFLLLTVSFLIIWVKKDVNVWAPLLGMSIFLGFLNGNILWFGLLTLVATFFLWRDYAKKPTTPLMILLAILTILLKLRGIPGFVPIEMTAKWKIGFSGSISCFLPLAFIVPLAKTAADWKQVGKALTYGILGILLLAVIAITFRAVPFDLKFFPLLPLKLWSNLILVSIPEEGFYRGFLQRDLARLFERLKFPKSSILSLFLTTIIFTAAHLFWVPNYTVLGFVFLAGLLYGWVYLKTEKIESAIGTHFLLNAAHMIFFSYHAI
ncbi:MAG TPA: CPBP family intramembrane glutamic endopeptidase [Chlamydiales bacterium]|nr:CPBP family intramembrane glutamic endopeptidase [Chlamydiales bacterium]